MTHSASLLPLGSSTFSALRNGDEIYVDKTAMIFRLAGAGRGKIFLARPRRFGKTLLISTFESLFRHGLRDFRGLTIETLWTDRTYPVLRLDFSMAREFQTPEKFVELFDAMIDRAAVEAELDIPSVGMGPAARLADFLSRREERSLVLLIDEYDSPLTSHLDDPVLFKAVREELSNFYAAVKAYEGRLRFLFLTGITKLAGTGLFSAFNNIDDITLAPEYGTLLGYTEEEIERSFASYLDDAAAVTALPHSELMRRMREHYDGFSFDESARTHVFSPWSTLNFLRYPERGFRNYWYASGGRPSILLHYLRQHDNFNPELFEEGLDIPTDLLTEAQEYESMSSAALMIQTGYLTLREETAPSLLRVGIPNREVAEGLSRLLVDEMLGVANRRSSGIRDLPKTLAQGSDQEIWDALNRIFNTVNYDNYPIRDESTLRFGLQMLLTGGAMMPRSEIHSALGRSDLEVLAGERHWVLELKFARSSDAVPTLLAEGAEQMRSRRYGFGSTTHQLHRAVLVFDAESRSFSAWRRIGNAFEAGTS